ncbi:MAG: EamA family transporter [Flavobacteriales bacterium]|nr:EamA family transporter [Flavobacteriales bacterium]
MKINASAMPFVILAILAFIWGASFILIKEGLKVMTPLQLAATRLFIAGSVFTPFVFHLIKDIAPKDRKFLLFSGLLGNGIPAFLFAYGETKVESSIAGALNALTPLFTLIIGSIFGSIVMAKNKTFGVLVGFLGALVLILGSHFIDNDFDTLKSGEHKYSLLIILATAMYGANVNLIKVKLSKYKALNISALPLFFLAVISGFILLFSNWQQLETYENHQIYKSFGAIALLAIFGNSISLIMFNRLLQTSGPIFASSVTYFIPIMALVFGAMDKENIRGIHAVGMLLILLGVYLVSKARNREN